MRRPKYLAGSSAARIRHADLVETSGTGKREPVGCFEAAEARRKPTQLPATVRSDRAQCRRRGAHHYRPASSRRGSTSAPLLSERGRDLGFAEVRRRHDRRDRGAAPRTPPTLRAQLLRHGRRHASRRCPCHRRPAKGGLTASGSWPVGDRGHPPACSAEVAGRGLEVSLERALPTRHSFMSVTSWGRRVVGWRVRRGWEAPVPAKK
jgi:hypothetical protein